MLVWSRTILFALHLTGCVQEEAAPVPAPARTTRPEVENETGENPAGADTAEEHSDDSDESEAERCSNGEDDDLDSLIDCADPDCDLNPLCVEQICVDGLDNDGNGLTDCEDADCAEVEPCAEVLCSDALDGDYDGRIDCLDEDCRDVEPCSEQLCRDGLDGDSDGLVDCEDADCLTAIGCVEDCAGVGDEDDDGLPGCFDDDCMGAPDCDGLQVVLHSGRINSSRREWSEIDSIHRMGASGISTYFVLRDTGATAELSMVSIEGRVRRQTGSVSQSCALRIGNVHHEWRGSASNHFAWLTRDRVSAFSTTGACGFASAMLPSSIYPNMGSVRIDGRTWTGWYIPTTWGPAERTVYRVDESHGYTVWVDRERSGSFGMGNALHFDADR